MINLMDYGYIPSMLTENNSTAVLARVTAVHKDRYELIFEQGGIYGCLKNAEYRGEKAAMGVGEVFPTVGDFVLIDNYENSECRIIKTLERKSYFSRLDPSSAGHAEQAVAANFDYVFIMQSLNYDFNLRRLERYLTLAWQSGAVPVVILTKADLSDDYGDMIRAAEKTAVGAGVFAVSAKTGYGLHELSEYLKPRRTIVFLGSSGVGKSSLVNALAGEEIMAVNEIREDDSRGRHTTTHRQLIMLNSGVMIIDTPGMRELGMWDVSSGLGEAFNDVEQYFGRCKFSDCKHQSEPGCAVKAAIESGELSRERWESYLNLKREAKFTDDKASYLRQKQEWHKSIAKQNKNMQKRGEMKK
ncbi:MAG: ribosome small subunit-dependent GTPase A [Oscillospiraceae bacterium]|nr:ribosome small subunit-dependent GTPase A [Oscillospiraceae bacterium]